MASSLGCGWIVRQAAPLTTAAILMITLSASPLNPTGGWGLGGGGDCMSKSTVFTSIRQARWQRTSKPIRIVMVLHGAGGRDSKGCTRPSGHITGLPLITSCHTAWKSLKLTPTNTKYVCACVLQAAIVTCRPLNTTEQGHQEKWPGP